jgi:hypothetical protein
MNLVAYYPLDLSGPDGLFDTETAEKFVRDSTEVRTKGAMYDLYLFLTNEGQWVVGTAEIGLPGFLGRQVDTGTARAWLEDNGYTVAVKRYFH